MKLWKAFKELEMPSDRLFRATYDGWTFEVKNKDGWFEFNVTDVHGDRRSHLIPSGAFNDNAKADLDWHEVKQPVTWQEAIQAWADGKKVVWEEDAERRVFDRNRIWVISKYQNHLLDQDGDAVTLRMISGGKWYVED